MIELERPPCPNTGALETNYKHPTNKEVLRISTHGKCMYCESKITHIDFADVEHIKPKADNKFPELKYSWGNLGYACSKCNNKKSNKYDENLPYVDPYSESPSDNIYAFGAFLFQRNGSERGELTIRDIGLNRPELLEKRQEKLNEIQRAMNACYRTVNKQLRDASLAELQKEAESDKEYSLVAKAMLIANNE